MMKRLRQVVTAAVIGGFIVLIPIPILYYIFTWLYRLITDMIRPLTDILLEHIALPQFAAEISVVVSILVVCFFVGNFVQTRFGKGIHELLEQALLKRIPLYKTVKEIFVQLFGGGKLLSCPVAIVQPFGDAQTYLVGFITADIEGEWYTVFVPTAPNPTSGWIFFLPKEHVIILEDVAREEAIRIVIAGGMGSAELFKKFLSQSKISSGLPV